MAKKPLSAPSADRRRRGFEPAFGLMKDPVRLAGETRGFAMARLLTQWAEVAGEDMARKTRPVKIGYGKGGLGATLTLLVRGADAPMVQMALPVLQERVNAVYGYAAVHHIHLTQTAATGFAEGQAEFAPAPRKDTPADPALVAKAHAVAEAVTDPGLRSALELLAQNILTRRA
ncbi:MAG: DciA family protein [Rhodobacterales bacterium]|nr:DciA family protein [Rhodobacterales bacterium]